MRALIPTRAVILPSRVRGIKIFVACMLVCVLAGQSTRCRASEADVRSGQTATNVEEGRHFWSFRPVQRPATPTVDNHNWPNTVIDRFVLARLEAERITPAEHADRRTLIRRAYFDLVGLPPTPAETAAFVLDGAPAAFERMMDRLLAAPGFGQRWGRHWLDVARFAESTGGGRTRILYDAWRYRDYVIDSFNKDKPFDRFVAEQLAGDLLPFNDRHQRAEQLAATGFLALGPTNYELQDKELLRMEVIDEQLDTIGRAFLGMTVGCARCHDHKFDPIPTRDYYALAGILRSTKTVVHANVSDFVERTLPVDPAHQAALDQHAEDARLATERLERVKKQLQELTDRKGTTGSSRKPGAVPEGNETGAVDPATKEAPKDLAAAIAAAEKQLKQLAAELKQIDESAPTPAPKVMSVDEEQEIGDCPIHIRGNVRQYGDEVPRGFLSVATSGPAPRFDDNESGRRQLAQWMTNSENPLTARVFANRVWLHLFGTGIVRTADNFGTTGERPTHPRLLDYLATRLFEGEWSTKRLVREITASRVYQLSSAGGSSPSHADPENNRLWRAHHRRLEAEAIRDAILLISGQLDPVMGSWLIDDSVKSEFGYQFSSVRRSVYVPVFRNTLHELFEVFDFANPNLVVGTRNKSTLPTQALYLMNSPFVMEQAERAAQRVLAIDGLDRRGRIELAYQQTLGRPPTASEFENSSQYLDTTMAADGRDHKRTRWANLYHTLFCCIDFRYVR